VPIGHIVRVFCVCACASMTPCLRVNIVSLLLSFPVSDDTEEYLGRLDVALVQGVLPRFGNC
jgi:hypothetical protein